MVIDIRAILDNAKHDIIEGLPHRGRDRSPSDLLTDAIPGIVDVLSKAGILPTEPPPEPPKAHEQPNCFDIVAWQRLAGPRREAVARELRKLCHDDGPLCRSEVDAALEALGFAR